MKIFKGDVVVNMIGMARLSVAVSTFILYPIVSYAEPAEIVVKKSNKCLDVVAESQDDGAEIQQYRCWQGKNQLWTLKKINDYYLIISEKSNKCLDVIAESKEDGARIQQYRCWNGDNQLWRLNQKDSNYFELISKGSGKCLDVVSESVADGARLQQYRCWGGGNQLFSFNKASGVTNIPSEGEEEWELAAYEGHLGTFKGKMRYGANGRYIYKNISSNSYGGGIGACSNAAFGGDPIPGVKKACYRLKGILP